MKFVGMSCALCILAFEIDRQLKEDKCICAACWCAFKTLHRSCLKEKSIYKQSYEKTMKNGERYWKTLRRTEKGG